MGSGLAAHSALSVVSMEGRVGSGLAARSVFAAHERFRWAPAWRPVLWPEALANPPMGLGPRIWWPQGRAASSHMCLTMSMGAPYLRVWPTWEMCTHPMHLGAHAWDVGTFSLGCIMQYGVFPHKHTHSSVCVQKCVCNPMHLWTLLRPWGPMGPLRPLGPMETGGPRGRWAMGPTGHGRLRPGGPREMSPRNTRRGLCERAWCLCARRSLYLCVCV